MTGRLEELVHAEGALREVAGLVGERIRDLTAKRESLATDVMRIARENPAQAQQERDQINEIVIRLDELHRIANRLAVYGQDMRPRIEARRGAA